MKVVWRNSECALDMNKGQNRRKDFLDWGKKFEISTKRKKNDGFVEWNVAWLR